MQYTFHGSEIVCVRSLHGVETQFAVAMEDDAYDYKIGCDEFEPEEVYPEIISLSNELSALFKMPLTPAQESAFEDHILERLARMVYGSNMIEQVGSDSGITLKPCMAVFRGEEVPEDIGEQDEDYIALKQSLMRQNLPANTSAVLQSWREIVQHAQATVYMINKLCLRGQDLSEEIILKARGILTHRIDANDTQWQEYSGVYRSDEVSAGLHAFPHHARVPYKIQSMIYDLNSDLKEAAKTGNIDPIALGSKYTHTFVNIHPFIDGNGCTCRLILNSMLLKYGCCLVSIGEEADDRLTYVNIAANGGGLEDMYENAEEDEKPKLHASFVLTHVMCSMQNLIKALKE